MNSYRVSFNDGTVMTVTANSFVFHSRRATVEFHKKDDRGYDRSHTLTNVKDVTKIVE